MKITFEKAKCLNAFKNANSATGKLNKINQYLLLSTDSGGVFIAGSDGAITVKQYFDADGSIDDGVCLESSKTIKAINSMNGKISIELKDGFANIKSGRSKLKIQTLPSDQFTLIESDFENAKQHIADDLITGINANIHASGQNDVRSFLNGVFFDDGYAVASDGHRLSTVETDISVGVIIPTDTAVKIPKLIDSESVLIDASDGRMHIKGDELIISTALINGSFPDWQKVFFDTEFDIDVNKSDLIDSIDIANITSNSQTNGGIIESDGKQLTISSKHNNDESISSIDCQCDEFRIGINLLYLSQCLKQCSDMVKIGVNRDRGIIITDGIFKEAITMMII